MHLPSDEQGRHWPWIGEPSNDTLLYFVQLMDELLNHLSPDGLRVVSLDSYHRLRELERTRTEATSADIELNLSFLFEELNGYLSRDPIVTGDFASAWLAAEPRLKSAGENARLADEAVRFLALKLAPGYLRKCRDYLVRATNYGRAHNRREFRIVAENYCSYLLNAGYHSSSILYRLRRSLFERNLEHSKERELNSFFSHFPHDTRRDFRVGVAVTSDFQQLLELRPEFTWMSHHNWPEGWQAVPKLRDNSLRFFSWNTRALDIVDARHLCEAHLSRIRAISYTAKPYANLNWDPLVVVGRHGGPATVLREPTESIRWARGRMVAGPRDISERLELFLDRQWPEADQNRLINAMTTYADAFHSESPSSQLVALWSSLEGLLPTPRGSGNRIGSFSRDVVTCLERLSFYRYVGDIHESLNTMYRADYLAILNQVQFPKSDHISRLAAIFCLPANAALQTQIGNLCSNNPLARQRLFELFSSSATIGKMAKMIRTRSTKVEWQIHRIYRERNRIVHRANPSANVSTLILTLNSYILGVFDALLLVGENAPAGAYLDDLFSEMQIDRDALERWYAGHAAERPDESHLLICLRGHT